MIVQTVCGNIEDSNSFYDRLNFTKLILDGKCIYTDGKVNIHVNEESKARPGIQLFGGAFDIDGLKQIANVIPIEGGHLLTDYSGVWVYLIEGNGTDLEKENNAKPSVLGNYDGVSIETTNIVNSIKVWEKLSFKVTMGSAEAGWVSLANENGDVISLISAFNCPHLFINPSLTYFNGKNNPRIIEEIRKVEIRIAEEVTVFNKEGKVDNVILQDPGGLGMFVFNDEV